ncbi:cation channel sperm-associated targeting subunit tau-like [Salminus brasiliensis]|uniref:cation channel sperm-associated targeting subunit tau-like n=1 Tax=Salminus brasiliensis TaxID=930266 RepID=UPI003B830E75
MLINERTHISVQISETDAIGHENSSCLMVELICIDIHTGASTIMGRATIKLLEILNKASNSHQFYLRLKDQKVCTVDADLVFSYGFLGYGYSHQIKHAGKTMASLVQKSCFLRCSPPEDQKDPDNNVVTPSTLPSVDVASLTRQDTDRVAGIVGFSIRTRGRLSRLHKAWQEFKTRSHRLQFLENLILKKVCGIGDGPAK